MKIDLNKWYLAYFSRDLPFPTIIAKWLRMRIFRIQCDRFNSGIKHRISYTLTWLVAACNDNQQSMNVNGLSVQCLLQLACELPEPGFMVLTNFVNSTLLEQLPVPQFVNELSPSLWKQKFCYRVRTSLHLIATGSCAEPFELSPRLHTHTHCCLKFHFNVILQPTSIVCQAVSSI
jgi:hypothetical protein